jgi:hypothetical protein
MDKKYKDAGSQCITETKAAEPHLPPVIVIRRVLKALLIIFVWLFIINLL